MNHEKMPYESLRRKRAIAVLLGIATLSIATAGVIELIPVLSTSEHAVQSPEPAEVRLLKQYEREAGVEPKMMKFITMPASETEARDQAVAFAKTLKAWHASSVAPIVIMEPTLDSGEAVDLTQLADGRHDHAINTYFTSLKAAGVTSEQMGMWVPLPEPNIPEWGDGVTDPALFTKNITKIAQSIKTSFPDTPVSIMLDSKTPLLDYVDIRPGLIDSFGLQGFTWNASDTPSNYLSATSAITAAQRLGVTHVWFNTGTYNQTFNPDDASKPVTATSVRRSTVLTETLTQAESVSRAGFHVDMINLFAQNTYNGTDGTANYSYTSPDELKLLKTFVSQARAESIPVTLFDAPR